ncbi:hypothetical protein HY837_01150 [archaeon]|nr:hypothetical protein [archaeon]
MNQTFDPAIYYEQLPEKYKKGLFSKAKLRFIKAVSTSLEGAVYCDCWGLFEPENIKNGARERYVWKYVKSQVENKVLELLKSETGDVLLLEQPQITIKESPRPSAGEDKHSNFLYSLRVNGELYRTLK